MVKKIGIKSRASLRFGLATSCLFVGLCAAGLTTVPGLRKQRQRVAVLWFRSLLWTLNVHWSAEGETVQGGSLQVANHISWLDIAVLGASGSTGFVAKAEVAQWPLVGRMAKAGGTVFLSRGAHQSGQAAELVAQRLVAGQSVVVFPEATTSDGSRTRHFYARFFAASIASGRPVQPIALQYRVPGGEYMAVPYIDDMSFGQSLRALLQQPRIEVQISHQTAIYPQGQDRKALAREARDRIVVGLAQS